MPRPDATTPDDGPDEAVARFVERFALLLTDAGIPRMPSRVFAALLATDAGQLTAAELASALRVSPAGVSGAVRYLTQVGLVERHREPGERRDHYRVYDDVWGRTLAQRDQLLVHWEQVLGEGVALLGERSPAGERLTEMIDFFAYIRTQLPTLLADWQAQRSAPRER